MSALIRLFDRLLRYVLGVFEFCDDPDCLFRLRVTQAAHPVPLNGDEVPAGAPVLELHLWNEHIPPLPTAGPDAAWATHLRRLLIPSFRAVARQVRHDPRLAGVRAVSGTMAFLSPAEHPGGVHLMQRLGFTVMPHDSPLGRFGEFWENFYSWWIMWAFNAVSLRHRHLVRLHRTEVWMSADEFLSRYGVGKEKGANDV